NALGDEVALGELRILTGHAHPLREVLDAVKRRLLGNRSYDLDRITRRLAAPELTKANDITAGLLDPVPAGDPEVEQPFGHVRRDLLWAKDAYITDARVVDGGLVVDG